MLRRIDAILILAGATNYLLDQMMKGRIPAQDVIAAIELLKMGYTN